MQGRDYSVVWCGVEHDLDGVGCFSMVSASVAGLAWLYNEDVAWCGVVMNVCC